MITDLFSINSLNTQNKIEFFRWNADGHYCLSCGKDSTIKLWNPKNGILVAAFAGHGRDVTDVDCTGDSEKIISRLVQLR